jgi:hypothetical protein
MDQGLLEAAKIHSEARKVIVKALREMSINSIDLEDKANAILARLAHENLLLERYKPGSKDEVIQWIDAGKEEPDDEIAVLMVIEECERPFFGYKIGDQWFHDCGDVVAGIVVYWADLPAVPE